MKTELLLKDCLEKYKIIICSGSGGVGKTTMSAALGMKAAMLGRKVCVVTIDPAKRLATSLGLKQLEAIPTDLTEKLELKMSGKFYAVMPDTQKTFENFVNAMAGPDQSVAEKVFRTSIFKIFAKDFSGANEYMAMEKLFDLSNDSRFDLIILDTPPAANARAFLEAPENLSEFFDDRIIKLLAAPQKKIFSSKLLSIGVRKIFDILESLTGNGFLTELFHFSSALFELRSNFLQNLSKVTDLFSHQELTFMIVTSPERLNQKDTKLFYELVQDKGYQFWGFIVNRVLSKRLDKSLEENSFQQQESFWKTKWDQESANLSLLSKIELGQIREETDKLFSRLSQETQNIQWLKRLAPSAKMILVEEKTEDVHSIGELKKIFK